MAKVADTLGYEVIVLGAGYAGLMAALGLAGRNRLTRIALVSRDEEFVERIRLQEGVSRTVTTRMPPLADFLANTKVEFIRGHVEALDAVKRSVRVGVGGDNREFTFDRCIYALGSRIDEVSVRGVADHAYRLDPGSGSRFVGALRSKLEASAGQSIRVVIVVGATGDQSILANGLKGARSGPTRPRNTNCDVGRTHRVQSSREKTWV